MKVTLLSDGGYSDMEKVEFPIVVEATPVIEDSEFVGATILGSELIAAGATQIGSLDPFDPEYPYMFLAGDEVEEIK